MTGKGAPDENFPVGSWLIARPLRPHIHAFYRFARAADDVADDPTLSAQIRLERLAAFATALGDGAGPPQAHAMARSLARSGLPPDFCLDLLEAFRRDAAGAIMADWDALLEYCRYSAVPVGRYLLALHGEAAAAIPACDALCSALQILNHIQDCGADYRRLRRIYLPADWLAAAGSASLGQRTCSPALRLVLDRCLEGCQTLLDRAAALPGQLRRPGLKAEAAVTIALARRLCGRLARTDPLAHKVRLTKIDKLGGLLVGLTLAMRG